MAFKDDFTKLPWFGQLGVFVAIAIAIVLLGYYLVITGLEQKISRNKTELSSLQIEIQKGRESKARTEQFQQELKRIEIQLEFLRKILPEKEELAVLYTKMQETASHFGLQVTSFKPGAAVDREFYTEYPIDIMLNSEYHSLSKFFEKLGDLQRIVNIATWSIKGKSFKEKPEFTLEAHVVASTYTYKEIKE